MNIYQKFLKRLKLQKEPIQEEKKKTLAINSFEVFNGDTLPSIVFPDTVSITALGQWLGILPSEVPVGMSDFAPYRRLKAEEVAKKELNFNLINDIGKRLSEVFTSIGITPMERIIIHDVKEEQGTFQVTLERERKSLTVFYHYGKKMESYPQFSIVEGKDITTYNLLPNGEVEIGHYSKTIDKTIVQFWSSQEKCLYLTSFTDQNIEVSVKITTLKEKKASTIQGKGLENCLLHVRMAYLPFEELFSMIALNFQEKLESYPSIIVQRSHITEQKKEVLDRIEIESGELVSFTLTRDKRKVTIGKTEDDWRYEKDGVTFEKSQGKGTSYTISAIDQEIDTLNPRGDYEDAKEAVQKTKKLTEGMLGKKLY